MTTTAADYDAHPTVVAAAAAPAVDDRTHHAESSASTTGFDEVWAEAREEWWAQWSKTWYFLERYQNKPSRLRGCQSFFWDQGREDGVKDKWRLKQIDHLVKSYSQKDAVSAETLTPYWRVAAWEWRIQSGAIFLKNKQCLKTGQNALRLPRWFIDTAGYGRYLPYIS